VKEIRKTTPFMMVSKIYLGINLTKEMKALFNNNYKTLKNELEEEIED
jgi:hypothetical protein